MNTSFWSIPYDKLPLEGDIKSEFENLNDQLNIVEGTELTLGYIISTPRREGKNSEKYKNLRNDGIGQIVTNYVENEAPFPAYMNKVALLLWGELETPLNHPIFHGEKSPTFFARVYFTPEQALLEVNDDVRNDAIITLIDTLFEERYVADKEVKDRFYKGDIL